MAVAVTAHPLSTAYRERFERSIGAKPEYVNLSHLRRLPPREIARTFQRLQRLHCFLPLEDPTSRVLLPVLEAFVALLRPRSLEIVDDELQRRKISPFAALPALAGVAWSTVDGQVSLPRARREIQALLASKRQAVSFDVPARVLHLNANLWFGVRAGGSVGHIAGVIDGFINNGYSVDALAVAPLPANIHAPVGFERLRVPASFGLPPEVNTYRMQRSIARQTTDAGRRRDAGLLYQRLSLATHAGVVAARALVRPFIVEYNGSEAWVQRHWGRGLRYEQLALAAEEATLRHAHLVITVSDVLRDELIERNVAPERIAWYPNGVDPSVFDPSRFDEDDRLRLRRAHGIPDDAIVATFIGTFGQWHGVDVLARAIRRLTDERPEWLERERVRFMLVGDGIRMPEIREILTERNPYCVLTGLVAQEEAPGYLAASDVLLSPHVRNPDGSRFFGSPTKLFEYMAMERPIVASRLDQIGEVLSPALNAGDLPTGGPGDGGELAVLTEPGDVDGIVAALDFLVARPGWRAALAAHARARALERHTWRDHVAAILDGLERVASLPEHP